MFFFFLTNNGTFISEKKKKLRQNRPVTEIFYTPRGGIIAAIIMVDRVKYNNARRPL